MIAYTDGGSRAYGGWGCYIETDEGIHRGYGNCGKGATNNVAEITAILECLKYVNSKWPDTELQIFTDSEYSKNMFLGLDNYSENGWVTKAGTPIKNLELWKSVLECKDNLTIKVKIDWVKGHSGVQGNEEADQLATKGLHSPDDEEHRCIWSDAEVEAVELKVKRAKVLPLNPLMTGKRWFFVTNESHSDNDFTHVYYTTTFLRVSNSKKGLASDDDHVKNAGSRNSNNHHSFYFTNEPIKPLEEIRAIYNEYVPDRGMPVLTWVDKLRVAGKWAGIQDTVTTLLHREKLQLKDLTNDIHATIVDPPRNVWKLQDHMVFMSTLLTWIRRDVPTIAITDVSEQIFETEVGEKKTTRKILPGFKGERKWVFKDVVLPKGFGTRTVEVCLGTDMPQADQLTRIVKDLGDEDIKFEIITWDAAETTTAGKHFVSCRFAVRGFFGKDMAIWFTDDANYRVWVE